MKNEHAAANGALTGAVLAAAASWSRYDDDTQRRLTNARDDARDALNAQRDYAARGEQLRLRLTIIQDTQVGFAVANATQPVPVAIPTSTAPARPPIFDGMEVAIGDLSWPPQPGNYDERGMVTKVGEMTALTMALTYQEVRAFIQGLVQEHTPNRDGKIQIFYAANALISVVKDLKLTSADYLAAWQRVFGASGSGTGPAVANHDNTQTPPSVQAQDPGINYIKPLGLPDLPTGYKHNNTDAASKWRLNIGGANINANSVVATFAFGQPYTKNGDPFQPIVAINDPRFLVTSVTNVGFSVMNNIQLLANSNYDIGISVAR